MQMAVQEADQDVDNESFLPQSQINPNAANSGIGSSTVSFPLQEEHPIHEPVTRREAIPENRSNPFQRRLIPTSETVW